jgi:hypothetical protein
VPRRGREADYGDEAVGAVYLTPAESRNAAAGRRSKL